MHSQCLFKDIRDTTNALKGCYESLKRLLLIPYELRRVSAYLRTYATPALKEALDRGSYRCTRQRQLQIHLLLKRQLYIHLLLKRP